MDSRDQLGSPRDKKTPRNLQTELDLMGWYDDFGGALEDATNDEYLEFLSTINSQLWTCQRLLDTTDATLSLLSTLKTSFVEVQEQTSTFQTQCEDLVTEEQRLETLSEKIGRGLAPFAELESMLAKLNRPGTDFVKTRSFTDMLYTLDWCLEDLAKYPNFKDTPIYLPRFRRCMTTALTLIRNFLVASLRETSVDVSKRMSVKNITETTQSALLYARFRVNAPELRDLVGEIEKRCIGHEELTAANASDLVAFARSSISDARSICNDEFELFYAYFNTGDKEVYTFLESLCKPLYDRLRPKITSETQLVKLCELCTLLQTRYMRDYEDPEIDPYDRSQLDFGRLIQSILQETQVRLVAGAQGVLKTAIEQFVPTAEDLDYPQQARLQKDLKVISPATIETDDSLGAASGFDTEAVFRGWYPSLRKSIWLLSRIYRLVNPTIFGDIAHKIVHSCTISLIKGSQQLSKRKTPVDGYLFLIKHLLTLKEQIVAFDIEYLPSETERQETQETLSGTFWNVYMKGGLFTRDGIVKLVSVGTGWSGGPIENMIDAKVELDATLRVAITSFTSSYASKMLAPLLAPGSSTSTSSTAVPSTNYSGKRSGGQLMDEVKRNIESEITDLRSRLKDYSVGDWRTREALVGAVQELVIAKYESFFAQLLQETSGLSVSGPVGISYRDVMDVDSFAGWSNTVFGVGGEGGGSGRPTSYEEGGGYGGGREAQGLGIGMEDDGYTDGEGSGGEDPR
ncbi:Sec34-like family-domain-containing protein [Peziza echinospora]|nr:Sec34-like family-domain-containing protein [Peziza echinospora]